jgi:PleD family two-component response regulator
VRAQDIAHGASTVGGLVTVSVGVATRLPGGEDWTQALLARADRQLYRAKAQGRRQVCADGGDGTFASACPETRLVPAATSTGAHP